MLTLEPARRAGATSRRKVGLALAGGGPLGAYYAIGALHALGESIAGLDLTRLHCYVGVSSGSVLSACLANGLDTRELVRVFITGAPGDAPGPTMRPDMLFTPAVGEYAGRLARLPGLVLDGLWQFMRRPAPGELAAALVPIGQALPAGLFDNSRFEAFLRALFSGRGRSNRFDRLAAQLYVVATNLDTGEAAVFGSERLRRVPISRAVQASTALPGLYRPVRIGAANYVDGALRRTMHASLALEAGDDLVICINPLVAFAGTGPAHGKDLARRGMATVLSQTFRTLIQSRMQVGMADYPESYPRSDILLLEPDRDDETMFFLNIFKYRDRERLAEHAYQRTRADLRRAGTALERLLSRHGLRLDGKVLRAQGRRLIDARPAARKR
ncbi:MAG: patatin-like phospholipase family protein [Steroidobacteraceae bacterium]|nr:patatin-like phospholipase family protein [Steroidobacteraceae bacterium]